MQAPQNITIGTVNPKLDTFDDQPNLIKAGGIKKINAIRVFYTDKYVRGFEIFYKLNAGDLLKAGHNVPKKRKELQSAVFEIGPDDYLSEILGSYQTGKKNKIVNITFISYRGKAQSFGGHGNESFKFCFPGFSFAAFKGGFKKQVEWLEIQTQPLPLEFRQEMETLGMIKVININIQNGPPQPPHPVFQPKIQVAKPQICTVIPIPPINVPQQVRSESYGQQTNNTYAPQGQQTYAPYGQQTNNTYPQPPYGQQINNIQATPMTSSKYPTFNQPPPLYPQYPNSQQPYNPYKQQ